MEENRIARKVQGGSNMTGTDLCVNKPVTVPVIFEPPCIMYEFGNKEADRYTKK